jgi:hypothetical protein
MTIADLLIDVINFIVQHILLPILPTNIPFYSVNTFAATLATFQENIIQALSGFGFMFPSLLVLTLVLIVILAESALFLFKIGKFLLNVARGSGA